jgi:hypothetical protein
MQELETHQGDADLLQSFWHYINLDFPKHSPGRNLFLRHSQVVLEADVVLAYGGTHAHAVNAANGADVHANASVMKLIGEGNALPEARARVIHEHGLWIRKFVKKLYDGDPHEQKRTKSKARMNGGSDSSANGQVSYADVFAAGGAEGGGIEECSNPMMNGMAGRAMVPSGPETREREDSLI